MENWPFDQPRNCAVLSLRQIFVDGDPILRVVHDEDDHGWQFLGSGDAREEDAYVVALQEVVELDPTVLEVADLPPGWRAVRRRIGDTWIRKINPYRDEME
jgi:hypothetical protein